MIYFSAKVSDDLDAALRKFIKDVQDKVAFSIAAATAHDQYEKVLENTSGSKSGMPGKVTGNLHESIYWAHAKDRSSDTVKTYHVSWNHKKAPHGHLIEFGTSKAPAYPFVRPAFDQIQESVKVGLERGAERLKEITGGGQ